MVMKTMKAMKVDDTTGVQFDKFLRGRIIGLAEAGVKPVKLEKPKEAQGSAWNANVRAAHRSLRAASACAVCFISRQRGVTSTLPGAPCGKPARAPMLYARGLRAQAQRKTQTQTHTGGDAAVTREHAHPLGRRTTISRSSALMPGDAIG